MKQNRIAIGLTILAWISSGIFTAVLWMHGLLPFTYRAAVTGLLGLLLLLSTFGLRKRSAHRGRRVAKNIFLLLIIGSTAAAAWTAQSGMGTLQTIHGKKGTQTVEYSLVVSKESERTTVKDILGATIYTAAGQDPTQIQDTLKQIQNGDANALKTESVTDYVAGASKILEDSQTVLLLNESYRPLIEEQIPGFTEKTKIISPVLEVTQEMEKTEERVVGKSESFLIYLSGIDSRGSLYATSRSDVNIVMAVNPSTKQICMLSVPRDSYVPIAGGGNDQYDKLTHAGIYGVQSSIRTLENLLEIPIDYYAKINFTSLIELVDVMGGIDLYNDEEFTSLHGKFHFPVGDLHLGGEKALAFARERYALQGGDLARGDNQLKVLTAIIEKALSPSILFHYGDVLSVAEQSMDMNVPKSKIVELINGQIENMGKWNIEKIHVSGHAESGLPSYAMPGYDLYMFPLDPDSVERAADALRSVMK